MPEIYDGEEYKAIHSKEENIYEKIYAVLKKIEENTRKV